MGSGSACAVGYWRGLDPGECAKPSRLVPQISALVLRRAPKRADPDQQNALSLASAGGRNLDACACFLGSMWGGGRGL